MKSATGAKRALMAGTVKERASEPTRRRDESNERGPARERADAMELTPFPKYQIVE